MRAFAVSVAGPNGSGVGFVSEAGFEWIDLDGSAFNAPGVVFGQNAPGGFLATARELPILASRKYLAKKIDVIGPDDQKAEDTMPKDAQPGANEFLISTVGLHGTTLGGAAYAPPPYWNGIDPPKPANALVWQANLAQPNAAIKVRRLPVERTYYFVGQFEKDGRVFFVGNPDPTSGTKFDGVSLTLQGKDPQTLAFRRPPGVDVKYLRACAFHGDILWLAGEGALWALDTSTGTGPDSWEVRFSTSGPFWDVAAGPAGAMAISGPLGTSIVPTLAHRIIGIGLNHDTIPHPIAAVPDAAHCVAVASDGTWAAPTGNGSRIDIRSSSLALLATIDLPGQVTVRHTGVPTATRAIVAVD